RAEEALQRAHDGLEALVRARTQELAEANERLQGLDRLKSMFIASMSHELRTPLNAILGFVGIVLQGLSGELNAKQEDHLGRAYGAAKHLLDLINDAIDMSKIEAGYVDVHIEDFSLRGLLEEAQTGLGRQGREKGLALEILPFEDLALRTDRKRVLQCILNLLSNAVKYTERGTVGVEVQRKGLEVEIEVRDTGVGIAPDAMVRLFQPFERIDSPLRIRNPGTGLGLYLTRKIATELLQGTVTAQSVPGQGSTFRLRLPRVLAPD
ncbi:MAG: sensor histidine kinase, partial [Gammaproteobacteria bacterium]